MINKSYHGGLTIGPNIPLNENILDNPCSQCREYKLESDIMFPSNENHSITFSIKCKAKRKIQISLIRNYQDKWTGSLNFFDLGYMFPKSTNRVFRLSSKKPPVLTYQEQTVPKELLGSKCVLVIRDISIPRDSPIEDMKNNCPFEDISWSIDIIRNKE